MLGEVEALEESAVDLFYYYTPPPPTVANNFIPWFKFKFNFFRALIQMKPDCPMSISAVQLTFSYVF